MGSNSFSSANAIPPAEKAEAIALVQQMEHDTFDENGHLRSGIDQATAERVVAEINQLRHRLGWLEVDLQGRWRWPVNPIRPAAA